MLTRVNDPSLRGFIELCLLPAHQRLSAREMLQHPFLSFKRSDPYRDGMLVRVDVKGGVLVGKGGGGAKGDGEEERVLREVEREGRRKEEEEEQRMRDAILAQHRHDSRAALARPQPIDTSLDLTSHTSPVASPPSHPVPAYVSPSAATSSSSSSTSPSPPLKRDMSMPSRLPSMIMQPTSAPTPALSPSSTHSPSLGYAYPHLPTVASHHPTISTRTSHTSHSHSSHPPPPAITSPQSAPPPFDPSSSSSHHPGPVTSVHVDVDSSLHHLASISLHIHFEKRKKQIRFEYNLRDDTSVSLASEMVRALQLGDQERMIMLISGVLEEKIDPYRRGYFEGMREVGGSGGGDGGGGGGGGGGEEGRLRTSGTMPLMPSLTFFPSHPALPSHGEHPLGPLHAHFPGHSQVGYPQQQPHAPSPHMPPARHPSTAQHRHFASSSFIPPNANRSTLPLSSQQRPPSLHTGPVQHVSGSFAPRQGAGVSRYQTLPQGFQISAHGQQPAAAKAAATPQAPPPLPSAPPTPAVRLINAREARVAAVGGLGTGGALLTSGMSPASASPSGPVASSRRSSMPLQPGPPLASSAAGSSPSAVSSPTGSASAASMMQFNATAPLLVGRLSSAVSHADSWTAYFRALPVAVLKEQVKAKRGAAALDGAMDKQELISMLVEATPPHEWPPPTPSTGKKSSAEDKASASRDSQPTSRHSSQKETQASISPPALASPRHASPLSSLPSLSPGPPISPAAHTSPPAAVTDEWANLAFDVVGAASKAGPEESKEIPRRASGSSFRDLDPLFAAADDPHSAALLGLGPAPLSSPSSASSSSSLYDFASLSPSQPYPSPPTAVDHLSARPSSSAFFGDLPSVVGEEVEGAAAHKKQISRNSILYTSSIETLSELVLGTPKQGGAGGSAWKGEEAKEMERVDEEQH